MKSTLLQVVGMIKKFAVSGGDDKEIQDEDMITTYLPRSNKAFDVKKITNKCDKHQSDINKMYLYSKSPYEPKYKCMLKVL